MSEDGTRPAEATSPQETRPSDLVVRATRPERSARILIVDDAEDNRDLYALYFRHSGFTVDEARDGEEALAMIAKDKPDVVIMDLAMPRLDGWEATRLIKSNPRTSGVIVIVVTGSSLEENLHRARAAGANEICTKPCLPRSLSDVVMKCLDARGA
jgi:two-component system cell cycle response regulator DivK